MNSRAKNISHEKEGGNASSFSSLCAALAQITEEIMAQRLPYLSLHPKSIGCLRGNTAPDWLKRRFPHAEIVADGGVDLLWHAFDPKITPEPVHQDLLADAWDSLNIGGTFLFATLGHSSLLSADQLSEEKPILADWPLMTEIGDNLSHLGFMQPVLDRETVVFSYADAGAVRKEFLREGWLVSEDKLDRVIEKNTTTDDIAIAFEIIFGLALKTERQANAVKNNSQVIRWYSQ